MGQLVQEKENSDFKPVKLRLKIDLVSYPAREEGLVNRIKESLWLAYGKVPSTISPGLQDHSKP